MVRSLRPIAVVATLVGIVVLVGTGTSATLSAWSFARVANPSSSAATGSLSLSHSAGSCAAGVRIAASTSCTGTPLAGDAVTNLGTVSSRSLTSSVTVASCGPVQLANLADAPNVLLPRYGVGMQAPDPWGGTQAATLDGTGYAGAALAQAEPVVARAFGVGVWFRASPGSSGPLLSFGTNPTALAGADRRALSLDAGGTVSFSYDGPTTRLTTVAGRSFADGAWHFAYARFTLPVVGATTASLTVDGGSAVSASWTVSSSGLTGYWHLGWAPTSLVGGSSAFFTGSLSNAVVFYGLVVPSSPTAAQVTSQSAFTAWAAGATEDWPLGDSGTTTFAGLVPGLGTASPCALSDISWSVADPAGVVAPPGTTLAALADATSRVIAAPEAGRAQTWTVTIGRRSAAPAAVAGLRLFVPVTQVVSAGGGWTQTFVWSSASAVVVVP